MTEKEIERVKKLEGLKRDIIMASFELHKYVDENAFLINMDMVRFEEVVNSYVEARRAYEDFLMNT